MKVVIYSTQTFEKEFLARSNQKKHDITLLSNPLNTETTIYAEGKDAVVVFTNDDVSAPVVNKLADLGVKYIATRSAGTDHIDKEAASLRGIKLTNIPAYSPEAIAEHTVALAMALNRNLITADRNSHRFNFRLDGLTGFNFYGKTVGLIGLGHIGKATAIIFNGLGCKVLGYDVTIPDDLIDIEPVTLETLLMESDIISLHAPLNESTKHMINKDTLSIMKDKVMLINTSRGGLIKSKDVLNGLKSGKIGYLGLDVYEYEKGLFFENHEHDQVKDPLLIQMLTYPNVLVTPHQSFLTNEALQQIADQTIRNLDNWQMGTT